MFGSCASLQLCIPTMFGCMASDAEDKRRPPPPESAEPTELEPEETERVRFRDYAAGVLAGGRRVEPAGGRHGQRIARLAQEGTLGEW